MNCKEPTISCLTLALLVALSCLSFASRADTLVIPDISRQPAQVPDNTPRPTRSMTMDQVREQFGEPVSIEGPVGDPPITRWIYDSYIVHFEREYVIHTVVNRK